MIGTSLSYLAEIAGTCQNISFNIIRYQGIQKLYVIAAKFEPAFVKQPEPEIEQ